MAGTPSGNPEKNKGGRPAKYRIDHDETGYKLCRNHGYTDEQLADFFGVTTRAIEKWKVKHPSFGEALRRGKDEFDCEHVEAALLKRAKGFVRKRISKRTYTRDGKTYTETVETAEEVPGNVRAQELWLANRNPRRWKRLGYDAVVSSESDETGVLVVPEQELDEPPEDDKLAASTEGGP
jgi:hypothetical protein